MQNKNLEETARHYFDVELPVSSIELKKAYRRMCLKLHPDIGGDEREFKEMQAAYKELTDSSCIAEVFAGESEYMIHKTTVDGIPLSELGLGLGETTNGMDCELCEHRGYITRHTKKEISCNACNGTGMYDTKYQPCRACKGTGKFKQARSGRTVDCRVCNGTGVFERKGNIPFFMRYKNCHKCSGLGIVYTNAEEIFYVKCHKCHGTGELPMFNPVLLKAAFK